MPIWRTMHLCMLGGTGLIAIGIWVRLVGVPAALVAGDVILLVAFWMLALIKRRRQLFAVAINPFS